MVSFFCLRDVSLAPFVNGWHWVNELRTLWCLLCEIWCITCSVLSSFVKLMEVSKSFVIFETSEKTEQQISMNNNSFFESFFSQPLSFQAPFFRYISNPLINSQTPLQQIFSFNPTSPNQFFLTALPSAYST